MTDSHKARTNFMGSRHWPSASSRSAWVSFRTTCSGVCLLLVVIVIKPSCPTHGRQDSHSTRINQRGSRQPDGQPRLLEQPRPPVMRAGSDSRYSDGAYELCPCRVLGAAVVSQQRTPTIKGTAGGSNMATAY